MAHQPRESGIHVNGAVELLQSARKDLGAGAIASLGTAGSTQLASVGATQAMNAFHATLVAHGGLRNPKVETSPKNHKMAFNSFRMEVSLWRRTRIRQPSGN